jgi:solute carrier family 25 carnitine/acylcarnitine transporter 20/29
MLLLLLCPPAAHCFSCRQQGLGATLLRNTPANAVYLGTFEVLKGQAAKRLGCKVRRCCAFVCV